MTTKILKALVILLCLCVLGIAGWVVQYQFTSGIFRITIQNQTSESISGLKITYTNIDKDILIPSIAPKSIYRLKIKPYEKFGENFMVLIYDNNEGLIQKETICGYFEKDYGGKATIKIKRNEKENRKIKFEIKSEVKI